MSGTEQLGPVVQCKVTGSGVDYPCEPQAWCDPACAPGSTEAPTPENRPLPLVAREASPPLRTVSEWLACCYEPAIAIVAGVLADADLRQTAPEQLARICLNRPASHDPPIVIDLA